MCGEISPVTQNCEKTSLVEPPFTAPVETNEDEALASEQASSEAPVTTVPEQQEGEMSEFYVNIRM